MSPKMIPSLYSSGGTNDNVSLFLYTLLLRASKAKTIISLETTERSKLNDIVESSRISEKQAFTLLKYDIDFLIHPFAFKR